MENKVSNNIVRPSLPTPINIETKKPSFKVINDQFIVAAKIRRWLI